MSYTPTIIINLDQLLLKEDKLEQAYFKLSVKRNRTSAQAGEFWALKEIMDTIKYNKTRMQTHKGDISSSTFKSCGLRITTMTTELTSENKQLRQTLDSYEIEYVVDY